MRYLILGLLQLRPMSLYDLHQQFRQSVSLFYAASFGSIQRALTQLIDEDLVIATQDPSSQRGRKQHHVTEAGRAQWRAWMHEPVSGANAEATLLAKVFLLGLLPADERAAVLDTLRHCAEASLAELEAVARQVDAVPIEPQQQELFGYQRATLTHGIDAHRQLLGWLADLAASGPDGNDLPV